MDDIEHNDLLDFHNHGSNNQKENNGKVSNGVKPNYDRMTHLNDKGETIITITLKVPYDHPLLYEGSEIDDIA